MTQREPNECVQMTRAASARDPSPNAPNDFAGCHYSAGMNCGFFGKFSVQPDRRDDLVNYLLQAAKLPESNPGCIHYIVSTSEDVVTAHTPRPWTRPRSGKDCDAPARTSHRDIGHRGASSSVAQGWGRGIGPTFAEPPVMPRVEGIPSAQQMELACESSQT